MSTPFAGSPVAEQMENAFMKTWATWGMATTKEQEQTAEQLETLLAQLAALQAKVQDLEAQLAAQKKSDE